MRSENARVCVRVRFTHAAGAVVAVAAAATAVLFLLHACDTCSDGEINE